MNAQEALSHSINYGSSHFDEIVAEIVEACKAGKFRVELSRQPTSDEYTWLVSSGYRVSSFPDSRSGVWKHEVVWTKKAIEQSK